MADSRELEILLKAKNQTDQAFKELIARLKETDGQSKNTGKSLSEIAKGQAKQDIESLSGSTRRLGAVLGELGPYGVAAGAGIAVVGGAALATVTTLVAAASEAIAYAGTLADLSSKTDASAEELQRLKFEASLCGVSMEAANQAVGALQRTMQTAPEKFTKLGIEMAQLRAMKPEEQLTAVGEALNGIEDPGERSRMAIELLGARAKEVLPLLRSDMDAAGDRAEALGLVMSGDMVSALDDTGDAIDTLHQSWEGLWRNIGAAIVTSGDTAGAVSDLADMVGFLSTVVQNHGPEITGALRGFGLAIPTREELSRLEALSDILSGRGPEINKGATPRGFSPTQINSGVRPGDSDALDAGIKKHIDELKRAEDAAKKWAESEVKSVKEIGDAAGRLRSEYEQAQAARDAYLGAFGDSAAESARQLDALIVQFEDIGEAQGGAFTTEQLLNFRRRLDEAAIALDDLHNGLGPFNGELFDAATASGEKLHQKLKEQGLTIEHSNGTWERIDKSVRAVGKSIDENKEKAAELENEFRKIDASVATVHHALDTAGRAIETFGGQGHEALGKLLADFGGIADAAGDFKKALLTGNWFDKVIAGANLAIGIVGALGDLIDAIGHKSMDTNDPDTIKWIQDKYNKNPNFNVDDLNQGPNNSADYWRNQPHGPNQAPTGTVMPSHGSGIDYVPLDGPAYLHQGEMVLPPPLAAFVRGSATSSTSSSGSAALERAAIAIERACAQLGQATFTVVSKTELDGRVIDERVNKALRSNRTTVPRGAMRRS